MGSLYSLSPVHMDCRQTARKPARQQEHEALSLVKAGGCDLYADACDCMLIYVWVCFFVHGLVCCLVWVWRHQWWYMVLFLLLYVYVCVFVCIWMGYCRYIYQWDFKENWLYIQSSMWVSHVCWPASGLHIDEVKTDTTKHWWWRWHPEFPSGKTGAGLCVQDKWYNVWVKYYLC